MKKIFASPIVVGILMALLCIGAAAGIYFGLISPAEQNLASEQARYEPNAQYTDPVTGPQLLKTAQAGLATAQHNVAVVQTRWDGIQTAKNPVIDFSDRYKAWLEYNAECQFDYAQRINAFLAHTGIKPMTAIAPLPTTSDPNMPAPTEIFEMPIGSISVFGSYDQIVNHIEAWNRFDRIVVLDGLDLTGYNPFMTATYTAKEYIFTNNSDKPGPNVGVGQTDANKSNATFENVPEYQVHIQSPPLPGGGSAQPGVGGAGGFGGGFGGAPGAFRVGGPPFMGGGPPAGYGGPPAGMGGPPAGYRGGAPR